MNADGSDPTQLTFDPTPHNQLPDWSPNGRKIVYEDGASPNGRIFVMNANGTDQRQLTTGPGDDFGAAWSPDGGSRSPGGTDPWPLLHGEAPSPNRRLALTSPALGRQLICRPCSEPSWPPRATSGNCHAEGTFRGTSCTGSEPVGEGA